MKKLLIMRHAKSSWSDAQLSDFERPLNAHGSRAAPFMGALLREQDLVPDLIISSTAVRAHETAKLVAAACTYSGEVRLDPNIYEGAPQTLLDIVLSVDQAILTVMLVGHTPGVDGLIRVLTDEIVPMPTAAIAYMESSAELWSDIAQERAQLVRVFRPKELMK